MNLIIIAALAAVSTAAKLDRGYLPPVSARTAGGSPGAIQPPLANSIGGNGGLGGLPKGSYSNDFQAVVVDAAAPGTRTSEEETGLGAPRISYGSTDSKVGFAAFTKQAAFRPAFNSADGQTAETLVQDFQAQRRPDQGFNQRTGQPIIRGPNNFGTAEGFESNAGSGFDQAAVGQSFNQGFGQSANEAERPERPRAALDRAASTVRFVSNVGPESYSYSFETDNGISAEESGTATNGVQAQGGYSYTGDDGQVYTMTYTADERGFLPQGAHLPTPPPIPEEILRSLEQNARDEAAGLIDDGSYDAQKYNAGSDYTESGESNGKYNHQSSKFGNRGEADATASGTFISQSNQAFARPSQPSNINGFGPNVGQNTDISGQFGSSFGQDSFNEQLGSKPNANQGQYGVNAGQSGVNSGLSQTHEQSFQGQSEANNGFGSKRPTQTMPSSQSSFQGQPEQNFGQNGLSAQNGFQSQFGQQNRPGQNAFTAPFGFSITGSNEISNSGFTSSGSFAEQNNAFGNINSYLPPKGGLNQNRPQSSRPQAPSSFNTNTNQQVDQEFKPDAKNEITKPVGEQNFQGQARPQGPIVSSFGKPQSNGRRPGFTAPSSNGRHPSFAGSSGATFNQQPEQSFEPSNNGANSFGSPVQSSNRFGNKNEYLPPKDTPNQNRIPSQGRPQRPNGSSTQFTQQFTGNVQPTGTEAQPQNTFSNGAASIPSSQNGFGQQTNDIKPQTPNRQPGFQNGNRFPSANSQSQFGSSASTFASQQPTSQPATELTTPLENSGPQYHGSHQTSQPTSFGSSTLPDVRPTQSQFGFNSGSPTSVAPSFGSKPSSQNFGSRPTGQTQFNQPFPGSDSQYSPSTPRPSVTQQPQGPDDSYYYNQPSKPFQAPSRFPGSQTNQFDRVTQAPNFQNNQFSSQNGFQSTKKPRPFAPAEPTTPTQSQSNGFSGITQASISPFPSEMATQTSQFSQQSQFSARPTQSRPSQPQFGMSSSQTSTLQQTFGSQTTVRPQRPTPGRHPVPQGQFGQQQNNDQSDEQVTEAVSSQQYEGEIYEYKKPAQMLPGPHHEDQEEILQDEQFGQKQPAVFGRQPSQQFSPTTKPPNQDDNQVSTTSQFNQIQGNRPQPRPQFGQQQQNTFLAQKKQNPQQFKQPRPIGNSLDGSESEPAKPQFGDRTFNACCQPSKAPTQGSQFTQSHNQFNSNFPSTQGSKLEPTTSSFAGKGEEFGGPRKPPSFDPETGYHY